MVKLMHLCQKKKEKGFIILKIIKPTLQKFGIEERILLYLFQKYFCSQSLNLFHQKFRKMKLLQSKTVIAI